MLKTPKKKLKNLNNLKKKSEGMLILYGGFKETSVSHQSCLLILTIRTICFYLILTMLISFPNIQTFILILFEIGLLVYIVGLRPFKSKIDLIQQIVFELRLLVLYASWFMLAIFSSPSQSKSKQQYYLFSRRKRKRRSNIGNHLPRIKSHDHFNYLFCLTNPNLHINNYRNSLKYFIDFI